jgi:hypothetical protein
VAHRGRQSADEALAAHLATGETVQGAAGAAGVSERTAFRRLTSPAFRQRVEELRREAVARAVGSLADSSSAAARRLAQLVASADERVALGAARATLELTLRAIDVPELERRVAELKKSLGGQAADNMIRIIEVHAPSVTSAEAERLERFRELYSEVCRERQPGELTDDELQLIAEGGKRLTDDAAHPVSRKGESGQAAGP